MATIGNAKGNLPSPHDSAPESPGPERNAPAIDWPRVANHLAEFGHLLDTAFEPRRLPGGLANINMLVRVDDAWCVFRRPPDGDLPVGAHDMAREHKVLTGLAGQLEIAPQSLHFCADPAVAGAPFQLLRYYEGRVVRGSDLSPLSDTAETGEALSAMLIDTLTRIHAVDTAAAGLGSFGRPEGFLARTAAGWINRARAVRGQMLTPSGSVVAQWLSDHPAIGSDQPTLLHNDFKLDNIILQPDAIAPLVIVDWDMATRGDPLLDLATLLSYWAEPGDPECMHRLAQMPTARAGFMTREQAAIAYARRTGRALDGFRYPRVLALFKLGTVFHQLHARYAAEGTTDPKLTSFASLADDLFDFAEAVVRGKYF